VEHGPARANTGQPGTNTFGTNNQQNPAGVGGALGSRDMEAEAQAYRVHQRVAVPINRVSQSQHVMPKKTLHKPHKFVKRRIKRHRRGKIHIRVAPLVKSSVLLLLNANLTHKKTPRRRRPVVKFGMILRQVSRDIPDLAATGLSVPLSKAKDSQFIALAPSAWKHFVAMVEMMHIMGYRHNAISPSTVVIDQFGYLRLGGWDQARRGGSVAVDNTGLQAVQQYISQRLGY
jgi:hypothetical protein